MRYLARSLVQQITGPSTPRPVSCAARAIVPLLALACFLAGCGKKGPPLPPLLKLPQAPQDFTVARFGNDVGVRFTVPTQNTDGSKPANVARVEVYRFTGPSEASNDQILKFGTRVATVVAKAPRDPNQTTDPDEPEEPAELEDEGLDQGAVARVDDALGSSALQAVQLPKAKHEKEKRVAREPSDRPLISPPGNAPSTVYVAVGFNKSGRHGPFSPRVRIPLVSPPMAPSTPVVRYDEAAVTVTWTSESPVQLVQEPPAQGELPGRFIGFPTPRIGFHVYDVSPAAPSEPEAKVDVPTPEPHRLTQTPIASPEYRDSRMEWGTTRCYAVRTVESLSGMTLESEPSSPQCVMLKDTFPPAAVKKLTAVATEHAISLIWQPNSEKDLAGYLVWRGVAPAATLTQITPVPIPDTSFTDMVDQGTRYVYAVQAVDKAGNLGPMSDRVEEIAR